MESEQRLIGKIARQSPGCVPFSRPLAMSKMPPSRGRPCDMRHSLARVPALLLAAATALAVLTSSFGPAAAGQENRAALAVFDFDYIDTSGEERDQRGEHEARLNRFMSTIKADLAARAKFRLVVPACRPEPCALAQATPSDVLTAARDAGADFLLIGKIHKMSTLVQWANVEAINVKTGQVVLDKLFTFRGDSDDAWARAEAFIADEIMTHEWSDR